MRWILLGAPRLEPDGTAPGLRAELPETAPAYLGLFLAAQGGWVARETVAAYLWPELPTERAQHNLRVALNRLGALLQRWGIEQALTAERRRLQLQVASDLGDFRAAVAAADWARAAALPAGPLLQGVQFAAYPALAEWLEVEREAVRRSWRKALVEGGLAGAAVDDAAAAYLRVHPADAEITSLLATRLAAAGRREQAQDLIAAFRHAAGEEMTTADLDASLGPMLQAVAAAASSEAAAAQPPLGREAELARLDAAVVQHRWVTVVGLPGSGKSTLVEAWMAAARSAQSAVPIVRLPVGANTSAAALVEALVRRLAAGAPAQRASTGSERLVALRGRVVLDGLDPATLAPELRALLDTLARRCPGLHVLATSRQALALPGEQVLRLGGLAVAGEGAAAPSAAARLFLREAQRLRPQHRWSERVADAERVARLCGGLPLALKLAASWSRWLEPAALADAIERSVRRPGAADDATLHAWIAAPYERLAPAEQQALAALALFPRGFDMAAAVAVAGARTDAIESLASQCLIDVDADAIEPGTAPGLRLHALVRAFAQARLAESPPRRREAIARYLELVAARLEVRRWDHGQPVIRHAQVAPWVDEVHAAWPLALQTGALSVLAVLVQALLSWHEGAGDVRAGERRLAEAEAALDEGVPAEAAVLARVQVARSTLLQRAGDHDAAERLAREGLRLAEATGQRRMLRMALSILGLSRWMTMRLDAAREAFQRGLASAVEDGEARGQGIFASNLALVEKSRGDYAAAEAAWRQAIEVGVTLGDWWSAATCLNNLANLLRHQRRLDDCEQAAQECLRLSHEHDLVTARPFALIGLALLRHAAGRLDEAEQYLALLDACEATTIDETVQAGAAQLRARIALDRGDGVAAVERIAQALRVCIDSDDAMNRAEALALYGDWLASAAGRPDEALRLWAALLQAPTTHATLRDELHPRLARHGTADAAALRPPLDLTLVAEQALAAARAAAPQR